MRNKLLLIGLLAAGASLLGVARADEAKEQAAVAKQLLSAKITLSQGLTTSESKGQPISGKFEVDEGHFQLSIDRRPGPWRGQADNAAGANNLTAAVNGRLDHMAVDEEKRRLFVAAVTNGTLEVLDLDAGTVINTIPGIKDAQDAVFLGGSFNKLNVSSLDGTFRIFQGETFRLIQALKLEPDPNRLLYDPTTDLIYFGYGGQNAGFDAYTRVGILEAKRGAQSDQFAASVVRQPRVAQCPRSVRIERLGRLTLSRTVVGQGWDLRSGQCQRQFRATLPPSRDT